MRYTRGERLEDSNLPEDIDTKQQYGGRGGHAYHKTEPGANNTPVLFVPGNTHVAEDWDEHAEYFLDQGYSGDELWAITFSESGPDHDTMRDELEAYVTDIMDYTGADSINLISHSLGVTGARYWMEEEDRYDSVDTFVGIAGANHGTPINDTYNCMGCGLWTPDLISLTDADHGDLYDLNQDETPGDIEYHTIRGTEDHMFIDGHEKHDDSPELDGARNHVIEGADHYSVRIDPQSKALMYDAVT